MGAGVAEVVVLLEESEVRWGIGPEIELRGLLVILVVLGSWMAKNPFLGSFL